MAFCPTVCRLESSFRTDDGFKCCFSKLVLIVASFSIVKHHDYSFLITEHLYVFTVCNRQLACILTPMISQGSFSDDFFNCVVNWSCLMHA